MSQETLNAEHQRQLGAIAEAPKTVDRIVRIARVLHYLDQVSF